MDPGDGGAAQGSGPQPEPSRQHQLRNVPRRSRQHLESVRCSGDLALLWIAWLVAAGGPARRAPPALSAPALTRYDAIFSIEMARRQLKSDIENSIDQIKERLLATGLDPRRITLRELMENELKPEIYGPEKCRDRAFTCRNGAALPPAPALQAQGRPQAQAQAQPQPQPQPQGRRRPRGLRPHPSSRSPGHAPPSSNMYLPGKARSAVIGLLWTNRAVGFVVVFMRAPQPQP